MTKQAYPTRMGKNFEEHNDEFQELVIGESGHKVAEAIGDMLPHDVARLILSACLRADSVIADADMTDLAEVLGVFFEDEEDE